MADKLKLHVNYDGDDCFMVSISKSKPVAALRSEIEIVAQDLSLSQKKVVCLESWLGSLLSDRYTVDQLLTDGDVVWAYSSSDKEHRRQKRKNHTLTRHNGKDRKAKRRRRPKLHQEEDSGTSDSDDQRDNKKGNTKKRSGDSVDPGSLLKETSNQENTEIQCNSERSAMGTKKKENVPSSSGKSGQNFTAVADKNSSKHSKEIILPMETIATVEGAVTKNVNGTTVAGVNTEQKSDKTGEDEIVDAQMTVASSDSDTEDCSDDGSSSSDGGTGGIKQGIKRNAGGESTDSSISFSDLDNEPVRPRGKLIHRSHKRIIMTAEGPKQTKQHHSVKKELHTVEDRVPSSKPSDDSPSDSSDGVDKTTDQRQGKNRKLWPTKKPVSEKNTSPARPVSSQNSLRVAVRSVLGNRKLFEKLMEQEPGIKQAIEQSGEKVCKCLDTPVKGEPKSPKRSATTRKKFNKAGTVPRARHLRKRNNLTAEAKTGEKKRPLPHRPIRRCTLKFRSAVSEGEERSSDEHDANGPKTKRNGACAEDWDGDLTDEDSGTGESEDGSVSPVDTAETRL